MKKAHASAANDARIIANAHHFEISLFLGTGQFAKAESLTLAEARAIAEKMKAEFPTCTRRPLIYAVTAEGRSTPVSENTFTAFNGKGQTVTVRIPARD